MANGVDTAARGTFMLKILNDMQDTHSQWQVERSASRKVNSVTEERNEVLTAKVDELIYMLKGNEG
jgi:hypothetical protein